MRWCVVIHKVRELVSGLLLSHYLLEELNELLSVGASTSHEDGFVNTCSYSAVECDPLQSLTVDVHLDGLALLLPSLGLSKRCIEGCLVHIDDVLALVLQQAR
jgi:hypothetical protein